MSWQLRMQANESRLRCDAGRARRWVIRGQDKRAFRHDVNHLVRMRGRECRQHDKATQIA